MGYDRLPYNYIREQYKFLKTIAGKDNYTLCDSMIFFIIIYELLLQSIAVYYDLDVVTFNNCKKYFKNEQFLIKAVPVLKSIRDTYVHVNTGISIVDSNKKELLLSIIDFEYLCKYIGFDDYAVGDGELLKSFIISI